MTMTAKRLAELDAVMAKATLGHWHVFQCVQLEGDTLFQLEARVEPDTLQCVSTDIAGEDDAAAIVALHNAYPDMRAHIDAQAATIARSRAEVERLNGRALVLEAHLTEAIERVEKGDLDDRMCCDGHMCGCQGSTNADQFLHFARAALTGAA